MAALMLAGAGTLQAQIAAPNAAGIAMGHLHYRVADIQAERDFWVGLGGEPGEFAAGATVQFPGVIILLSQGDANEGSEGSVLNHVAFRVESLAAIEAQGYELEVNEQFPGIASVFSPSGERIELFDNVEATNTWFEVADGHTDAVAERHNAPVTAPIVTHHIHFYLPEEQVQAARDWYVEYFGATPGMRWRYDAADLPGFNLNFSATEEVLAPTRGRKLDHIGFEVRDLEAFTQRLEAAGIEFDSPYRKLPSGLGLAFLTDPWGTYIELTEGLGSL